MSKEKQDICLFHYLFDNTHINDVHFLRLYKLYSIGCFFSLNEKSHSSAIFSFFSLNYALFLISFEKIFFILAFDSSIVSSVVIYCSIVIIVSCMNQDGCRFLYFMRLFSSMAFDSVWSLLFRLLADIVDFLCRSA